MSVEMSLPARHQSLGENAKQSIAESRTDAENSRHMECLGTWLGAAGKGSQPFFFLWRLADQVSTASAGAAWQQGAARSLASGTWISDQGAVGQHAAAPVLFFPGQFVLRHQARQLGGVATLAGPSQIALRPAAGLGTDADAVTLRRAVASWVADFGLDLGQQLGAAAGRWGGRWGGSLVHGVLRTGGRGQNEGDATQHE